jgi:hypothetical protein
LFRLLLFGQENGLLHLAFLILALLVQHVVLLRQVALSFVLDLIIVDFLKKVSYQRLPSKFSLRYAS